MWVYTMQTARGTVRYPYTEILHIQPFFDASPISLGREALATAAALSSHLAKLLANGASPGGIITAPKSVTEEGKGKLKKAWTDTHSGPKSGGVALLDEGMAYQQITMTLTDAQFSENRLEQIHEVARIFRVPPTMPIWQPRPARLFPRCLTPRTCCAVWAMKQVRKP